MSTCEIQKAPTRKFHFTKSNLTIEETITSPMDIISTNVKRLETENEEEYINPSPKKASKIGIINEKTIPTKQKINLEY